MEIVSTILFWMYSELFVVIAIYENSVVHVISGTYYVLLCKSVCISRTAKTGNEKWRKKSRMSGSSDPFIDFITNSFRHWNNNLSAFYSCSHRPDRVCSHDPNSTCRWWTYVKMCFDAKNQFEHFGFGLRTVSVVSVSETSWMRKWRKMSTIKRFKWFRLDRITA